MKDLIYDEWLPYDTYEKNECDIKLHDGTILKHYYPNAGDFHACCDLQGTQFEVVKEQDVAEIMYREYYLQSICEMAQYSCNGAPSSKPRRDPFTQYVEFTNPYAELAQGMPSLYGKEGPTATHPVRTEPKISRNAPCPCGSGKKHKKCCLKS